jgi:hypothetical protein
MIIKFNRRKVRELMEAELSGPPGPEPYTGACWNRPEEVAHGLCLVGDHGIYLICNRGMKSAPSKSGLIAYAEECNPHTMGFDDWYANKNAIFGGDDGAVFLPALDVSKWLGCNSGKSIKIDLNPSSATLLGTRKGNKP